ncbi:hypothetical protein BOH66_02575 [Microbacterium aurum]|uniref:KAP NTPase domain-containing protein n=1 Tax=Microbacterium aurum TaxID=36805 RepID=A0A1P8U5A6_9MICO|nr:P-loop NTPase fold protein [Microbacterium aurum]APZ33295.1 hypothetical protein BOH66_02575 [Microbacterium aurum]MBM7826915.1 energy-coupling factor transporter ATP-binding protein EcfA2 [Microbacterium aurum]
MTSKTSVVTNRIVADVPTEYPGLGFEDYAAALTDAIAAADRPQFTVGLYGKWGSGKSSLLKAMNRILEADANVITVEFDAWRYQRSQEIVIPLLHAVFSAVQKTNDHALARAVGRLLRAFGVSLGFKIPVVGIEFSAADVRAAWDEESSPPVTLDDAFARPFEELRRVGEALDGRRIVVFVDDLDRCTTENVVGMLESINVITDVAGFVFVLALDYDVVTQAVQKRYPHANGHEFIEKIIQVPFRIPSAMTTAPGALEALVPGFSGLRHLEGLTIELEDAIEIAFRGNPRSVKRFVNALTLLMRILESRRAQFNAQLLTRILRKAVTAARSYPSTPATSRRTTPASSRRPLAAESSARAAVSRAAVSAAAASRRRSCSTTSLARHADVSATSPPTGDSIGG